MSKRRERSAHRPAPTSSPAVGESRHRRRLRWLGWRKVTGRPVRPAVRDPGLVIMIVLCSVLLKSDVRGIEGYERLDGGVGAGHVRRCIILRCVGGVVVDRAMVGRAWLQASAFWRA